MLCGKNMSLQALRIEHDAIIDAEAEEPGSERPHRTDHFEDHYVGKFQVEIFEYPRFYKRKKGKRAGRPVAIYVDPKTGKGTKSPATKYIQEVYKKIDAVKYNFDPTVLRHLKDHIKIKILKNQRETVSRLRKEKERLAR